MTNKGVCFNGRAIFDDALKTLPADMEAGEKVSLMKKAYSTLIMCLGERIEDEDHALMLLTSLSSSYENFMETFWGHLKRDCPMKKLSGSVRMGKHDQDSDSSNDEGNIYFGEALVVVENDELVELVMDSGGSYHMKHRRDFLYDFKGFDAKARNFGVQNHGDSKQVGFKQLGSKHVGFKQLGHKQVEFKKLGPRIETGVHGVNRLLNVFGLSWNYSELTVIMNLRFFSKDRPPMLAPGNYIQWKSRIKRYIDTKPNHELIHFCLTNPPYELGWKEKCVLDSKGNPTTATQKVRETCKTVTQEIRDQLNAEAKAV
nr:zinc finger, CCHC-type [Tanacetum cinerariifolium]